MIVDGYQPLTATQPSSQTLYVNRLIGRLYGPLSPTPAYLSIVTSNPYRKPACQQKKAAAIFGQRAPQRPKFLPPKTFVCCHVGCTSLTHLWLGIYLTIPLLRLLLNPAMMVLIWKLSWSTLRWVPMCQGFQSFLRFFGSFSIGQISHQQHKG